MKKNVLKSIGDELLFIFAIAVFISLVTALGMCITLLLMLLGRFIGIGNDILLYFTLFCISWKAWDALAWIVGWIADKTERKKEREYFERLNKSK